MLMNTCVMMSRNMLLFRFFYFHAESSFLNHYDFSREGLERKYTVVTYGNQAVYKRLRDSPELIFLPVISE